MTKHILLYILILHIAGSSCKHGTPTQAEEYSIVTHDSIHLAGTLTQPEGRTKRSLIILVHGSGDDSRQNEYYKMLTREFTRIGFAVFTYDKRGCGHSAGEWISVPFSYLKDDVLSVVNHFDKDTLFSTIGLWGGSEGSNIAVWAASENEAIDFVIAQSFTAMSFAEQNKYVKSQSIKRYSNVNQEKIDDLMKLQDVLNEFVRTGNGYSDYITLFNSFRYDEWFTEILGQPVSEGGQWVKWYKTKMDINSTEFTRNIRIPSLFIWGQNDPLIDVHQSMTLIQSSNQSPNLAFKIFENADHSLYTGGSRPIHIKYMKEWLIKVTD